MDKIIVETPSRLHFTLIDLNGEIGRVDGGIGVALKSPRTRVEIIDDEKSIITGSCTHLVKTCLERFLKLYGLKVSPSINVVSTIPQHVGLGSKTQLSLAVCSALGELYNLKIGVKKLAEVMSRGGTSGVGVAAFSRGGFILDGGHSFGIKGVKKHFTSSHYSKAPLAPVLFRHSLPRDWYFVIAVPKVKRRVYGVDEAEIFEKYCPIPRTQVEKLSRLVLLKVLPSIVERDIFSLGSALTEIQNIGFKRIEIKLQHPIVKLLIKNMLSNGAVGAGMSSFGPVTYGLTKNKKIAEKLRKSIKSLLELETGGEIFYSQVDNHGAVLRRETSSIAF